MIAARELDLATVEAFERQLERACAGQPRVIALDLRMVEFMDATGFGAIVRAQVRLRARDIGVTIGGLQPQPRRLIELIGLQSPAPSR